MNVNLPLRFNDFDGLHMVMAFQVAYYQKHMNQFAGLMAENPINALRHSSRYIFHAARVAVFTAFQLKLLAWKNEPDVMAKVESELSDLALSILRAATDTSFTYSPSSDGAMSHEMIAAKATLLELLCETRPAK